MNTRRARALRRAHKRATLQTTGGNTTAMSPDRRAITSRKNLERHIPKALHPAGVTIIAVRVPNPTIELLDRARGQLTRSAYLRQLLERELSPSPE